MHNKVIDMVLNEIRCWFNSNNTKLLNCVACFLPKDNFVRFDKKKIIDVDEMYLIDFSPIELIHLENEANRPNTFSVHSNNFDGFKDIIRVSGLA